MTVYVTIALAVVMLCALLRRSVGDKLVGSDTFGSSVFYLGMVEGAFRYACIIVVGMAFLNARYFTPEEVRASTKYQLDNYGSSFFLTLPDLQQEVFTRSFTGKLAREYLNIVLIRPTSGDGKSLGGDDAMGRKRERSVYDLLDKR